MTTHRPRNVNTTRAMGILYGDWGTSKAYVIGLAFALAGYASFWPILAVSILSLFVGLNYIIICKYYPNGGGVYASVRKRSKVLAIIGAFFLIADYLVTAALSALAAFNYLGVSNPVLYSAIFIFLIGCFNFYGPRHTGTFAFIITIAAISIFTVLALLSLPFLKQAWHNLQPAVSDPLTLWTQFTSVIVALSGVETIANTTSIMQLNPKTTPQNPIVTKTSTPAIIIVMTEVIIYTVLFGLAVAALPNLQIKNHTVSAPGFSNVSDYMLSYLALIFGSEIFGQLFGIFFSHLLKIIVALILLSAVNSAINGLVTLQYLMASDEELPPIFKKVNRFGVPLLPLLAASIIPPLLILGFKKIILLADLYAIGFVGAIATNLGASSTDSNLPLTMKERILMFGTFLVMAAIEITLFIQKSEARYFVVAIIIIGLGLRAFVRMRKKKKYPLLTEESKSKLSLQKGALLCVIKKFDKAVKDSVKESREQKIPLNIVFVREQRVISDKDLKRTSAHDPIAKRVFEYAHTYGDPELIACHYTVTDSFANIAIAYAERLEASCLIVDAPVSKFLMLLRGNYLNLLQKDLPEHIDLVVM